MSRRPAVPVELAELQGWLRAAKGQFTFAALARRAGDRGTPVSVCTLRRALDGRLPTLYTVRAFARGAGADEEEAGGCGRRPRLPYAPGLLGSRPCTYPGAASAPGRDWPGPWRR
ncbi:hypothetical protein [Streptomyces brasiliscabiei]|uniref:hypothetical protein n=1 Tax=Streptomyces brasiliscabiei TaxID=2736302 RepID=UPI001C11B047|nr:hypothetical protein [Streptomyces brasiliscabiei]